MAALEKLDRPPVNEVVGGLLFDPVPGLDPLVMGLFWQTVKDRYPSRQFQPALSDQPGIVFGGTAPIRVWLIAPTDDFLIQVQADRFYLNWRARGGTYPRCNDHDRDEGILSRLIHEFEHFRAFCSMELEHSVRVRKIEQAKIDLLLEGTHWHGFDDLTDAVPLLAALRDIRQSDEATVTVRFGEEREAGQLAVSIDTGFASTKAGPVRMLKLETRLSRAVGAHDELREVFRVTNEELNAVFSSLIPLEERKARFGSKGETDAT